MTAAKRKAGGVAPRRRPPHVRNVQVLLTVKGFRAYLDRVPRANRADHRSTLAMARWTMALLEAEDYAEGATFRDWAALFERGIPGFRRSTWRDVKKWLDSWRFAYQEGPEGDAEAARELLFMLDCYWYDDIEE